MKLAGTDVEVPKKELDVFKKAVMEFSERDNEIRALIQSKSSLVEKLEEKNDEIRVVEESRDTLIPVVKKFMELSAIAVTLTLSDRHGSTTNR